MDNFAIRLRELRKDLKLSQVEVAKATGISKSVISQYELGESQPTAPNIIALAKFFDVTTDYILGVVD